jgi:putative ABC transport system permease protein
VTISAAAAAALGTGLGQALNLVVLDKSLTVVGLTDEPSGEFVPTGYVSLAFFEARGQSLATAGLWAIKLKPGVSAAEVIAALDPKLAALGSGVVAKTGDQGRTEAMSEVSGAFMAATTVFWAVGAVAVLVGGIVIANTFAITLAQRRRQIGLLRAIGAESAQVRRRFRAEAALLGIIGSALGVALGVGLAAVIAGLGSLLYWGLVLPWSELSSAFAFGVVATLIAASGQIRHGTKVTPMEALRPPAVDEQARVPIVRGIVCGLLVLVGVVASIISVTLGAFALAFGGGLLIATGVLIGAPYYLPTLLRWSGRLLRPFGVAARLAAANSERDPRRVTATATGLMLAIGLMVTLQVSTASIGATVLDHLRRPYPADLQVNWVDSDGRLGSIPADAASRLSNIPGVTASVLLPAGTANLGGLGPMTLVGYGPGVAAVNDSAAAGDAEVLVNAETAARLGPSVEVAGANGSLTLTVRSSTLADQGQAVVSAANLAKVSAVTPEAVIWMAVPDHSRSLTVATTVLQIVGGPERVSGAAKLILFEFVMRSLLTAVTVLFGIAVLIALIGVSNTLGLSVLERTRESALLRALGMQAGMLRAMLTIEALQVTLVSVIIGVIAGLSFGWLATASMSAELGTSRTIFAVDVPQTLGMIAVAVLASALASVLPGRRAAKASPTEALAEV